MPRERIWGWDYLWAALAKVSGVSLAQAAASQCGRQRRRASASSSPHRCTRTCVSGTHSFHAVEYLTPTDYTHGRPGADRADCVELQPHAQRDRRVRFRTGHS